MEASLEFGSDQKGRPAKIVQALYSLKSSDARFRAHCAGTLLSMGFTSCQADPYMWMRAAVKKNGTEYYEYVLCYVDDILCSSEQPSTIMDQLSKTFKLKDRIVKGPGLHLGAIIEKLYIHE
eukprot:4972853-Ditylum_brightwellii.AAC.1